MPEMMSKEDEPRYPHLQRKYGTQRGMGVDFRPLPLPQVDRRSILTATPTDIERIKMEFTEEEEQEKRSELAYYFHGIMGDIFPVRGDFESPFPSVQELLEKAKKFAPNDLRQQIEQTCNAQIEKIETAKKILAETYTREKLEGSLWNRKPITISLPNINRMSYVSSLDEVEELLELTKEKQTVLDYFLAYYEELKRGYAGLIEKLEEATPAIIKANLAKMSELCETA